jgi:hypothetical protein
MKKVIFGIMLLMGANVAMAHPGLAPMAGAFGLGVVAMKDSAKGIPACYYEEDRLVKWKDNPGYSFGVAGCDYQAKKDRLVIVK